MTPCVLGCCHTDPKLRPKFFDFFLNQVLFTTLPLLILPYQVVFNSGCVLLLLSSGDVHKPGLVPVEKTPVNSSAPHSSVVEVNTGH